MCAYAYLYALVNMYTCIHLCNLSFENVSVYIYACVYKCIAYVCVCTCICTYISIHLSPRSHCLRRVSIQKPASRISQLSRRENDIIFPNTNF